LFGELVRSHRLRLGLTQNDLAAKAELGVRSVRDIEAGRVRPRQATVRALADALALMGADRDRYFDVAALALAPEAPPADRDSGPETWPVPAQLPHGVVGFVGRAAALAALEARARRGDTVVITAIAGAAGVGKTSLAVHWAHRVAARFPDGQLYVNLRGFDSSGSVMTAGEALRGFLQAFGVAPERVPADPDAQIGLYRSLLAGRRVLVVLDNARDSEHVRPLLPGAAGCLAVVTSRSDLSGLVAVDGARAVALDVLSVDESWQLLAQRLGPTRVAAESAAAEEIIVRCGRLPLALAVVAARAAGRSGAALAQSADELRRAGLEALSAADVATDVRAVFGWSYRALGEGAARLFRWLGLHPGPDVSTAAAASLAGDAPERVEGWLGELTRAHLLTEPTPGRFAFHDLLRAYAGELAAADDPEEQRRAAVARVLAHYLHTACAASFQINRHRDPIALDPVEPGVTPESPSSNDEAVAWFGAERAVLVGAVGLAARLSMHRLAWQLAWSLVSYLARSGHWRDQVETGRVGLDAATRTGDRSARALMSRLLGSVLTKVEYYDESEVHLNRALRLYERMGDLNGEALTRQDLSWLMEFLGRHRESLAHDLRALEIARVNGNDYVHANALNAVGWDYAMLGEFGQTIDYCTRALAELERLGEVEGQACAWDSLGYSHRHLGDHARAVDCHRRAVRLFQEAGNRYLVGTTNGRLMDALVAAGDLDGARAAGERALAILDELGHSLADDIRERLARLRPP
jgi:tetratricopeptide (TPR) repeat protein/transcriptional regulator with XRE-family HTH domain